MRLEYRREPARRIAAVSRDDAQLRAMLAVMVEGVLAIDESDRILFINGAAKSMFDVELEECRGRSLWELAPISELQDLTKRTRSSSALARAEFDMFRTGQEQVIDAHSAPLQAGDESGLVIVLHDNSRISETEICERLRRLIQEFDWTSIHPDLSITASFGVTTWDRETDVEALIAQADRALYEAKGQGRNCVISSRSTDLLVT